MMVSRENWKIARLGDLIRISHGWAFKGKLFSEDLTGLPVVVGIGNFMYSGGFRFESTTIREYRGGYPAEYELAPGDILVVMTCQTQGGEILGIPGRIPDDGRTYLHNQRLGKVVILAEKDIAADYVYWLFLWKEFNRELCSSATGTKILHTAPSRIEDFKFLLPPMAEQKAVAQVLGALDEKIELNRRMNQTLEAMSRAIFKSWFVDFEPVWKAHKLFPRAFEDSSWGKRPSGWGSASFLDIVEVVGGGTPKTTVPEYWGGGIPWFSVVDAPSGSDMFAIATQKSISKSGLANSATHLLPFGSTIISARGTVGKVALVGVPMAMNQSCYGLVAKNYGPFFTYFSAREIVATLKQRSHGSVFDTITRDTFAGVEVVTPPLEVAAEFDRQVSPYLMRILGNLMESSTLVALRDTLLPKLLSGEIRIKQAEKIVGEVA